MKYNLVTGKVFVDGDSFTTYGIELEYSSGDTTIIEDISPDIEFVNTLIKLLHKHQASPIHLNDIIEDYIL